MESAGLRRRQRLQNQPPEPTSTVPTPPGGPTASRPKPSTKNTTKKPPLKSLTSGHPPPIFTINLALPPAHRYDHIATAMAPALAATNFESLFDEAISLLFTHPGDDCNHDTGNPTGNVDGSSGTSPVMSTAARLAQRVIRTAAKLALRRVYSDEETAELRGISRTTGVEMNVLVAFNVVLDVLVGCTSGGVKVVGRGYPSNGENYRGGRAGERSRMVHFRTLDWDMDGLRNLVVELEWVRKGGGPVVARTVGYFGYVGVLTGVRRGLSLSLNFRSGGSLDEGWGRRWARRWHQVMVVLGWRRSVSSVLRGYLLGEEEIEKKKTQKDNGYHMLSSNDGEPPDINTILGELAHSASTSAYLIFCTPERVYSVEKDHRTAMVESSNEFLTTCNHDIADETDPSRVHAVAQTVAGQGMAAIVDDSLERKKTVEKEWKKYLRARRKLQGVNGRDKAVMLDHVLRMVGHQYITYGGTHYAVIMDPEFGRFLWRRAYRTEDLRWEDDEVEA